MSFYGVWTTWKVVYNLPAERQSGGIRGVAFVEAGDRGHAMQVFREQYEGQFFTVDSIEELKGGK